MQNDRRISHTRAAALAWGAYVFYTIACAWPDAGWCPPLPAFPMPPGWAFVVLCLGAGLLASRKGWPMIAGYGAGCLGAILLRGTVADDGAFAAAVGFTVAFVVVAGVMLKFVGDVYMDEDGQVPTREAATLLWLAGCLAAGGGVVLADVIAWVGGYAS
jgi:hypothetical protein